MTKRRECASSYHWRSPAGKGEQGYRILTFLDSNFETLFRHYFSDDKTRGQNK